MQFRSDETAGEQRIISDGNVVIVVDRDADGVGDHIVNVAGSERQRIGPSKDKRDNLIQVLAITSTASGLTATPDAEAGEFVQITLATGASGTLAIAAPTNPPSASASRRLTIEVANNSGGTMGNITFNAAFITAGVTVGKPADTKKRAYSFVWSGTKWLIVGSIVTDY